MKLNLGCGFNKVEGYINVDSDPLCKPDVVHDLEVVPWPFEDSSVEKVLASHVLEHLGQTTKSWIQIMQELWRVCKDDALIEIHVPHPRHDNFLHDPTHIRAVTPVGLAMFDQLRNIDNHKARGRETKLGLMSGVDFELLQVHYEFNEPWRSALKKKQINEQQMEFELATKNNVCEEVHVFLKVHKPARGAEWLANYKG